MTFESMSSRSSARSSSRSGAQRSARSRGNASTISALSRDDSAIGARTISTLPRVQDRPQTSCTGRRPWFPRQTLESPITVHPANKRVISRQVVDARKRRKWRVINNIPKSPAHKSSVQRRVTNRFTDMVIAWRNMEAMPILDASGKSVLMDPSEVSPLYSSFSEDNIFPHPSQSNMRLVSPMSRGGSPRRSVSRAETRRKLLKETRESLYEIEPLRCASAYHRSVASDVDLSRGMFQ